MTAREYITDLYVFARQLPPSAVGLLPVSTNDTLVKSEYVRLLDDQMIPHEAASKIKHVIGFDLYDTILNAYWPEFGEDGQPLTSLPTDPKLRDQYTNVKLAELHLIGAGIVDFAVSLKQQSIGRVRSADAGSEAEFELRADDTAFYAELRRRYVTRAYAALRRAGYDTATTALVSRVSSWQPTMDTLYTVTRAL